MNITFSILFIFYYSYKVYDQYLWKIIRIDKIPNLSGTWIGKGRNPYFEHPGLEIMEIRQCWTKINIRVDVYEENESNPEDWLKAVRLGTEHSIIAYITECECKDCKFIFNYSSNPSAIDQPPFDGVMFLDFKKEGKSREIQCCPVN